MISLSTLLQYYKREDIRNEIVNSAKNKEVAIRFGDKGFGKRPDILQYPQDVLELAKQGATSFHISEERWNNPLMLAPNKKKAELDEMRSGWDLVLDIDCKDIQFSKITAYYLIEALKHHGIRSISVKFSGNKGFHIGVPYESFPEKVLGKPTKTLFPEGPKVVAAYLREMIRKHLAKKILEMEDVSSISQRFGIPVDELAKDNEFDPFKIVDIDTILISSRHLYRSPYSLNEKSGLASIPIGLNEVLGFKRESAMPEKVKVGKLRFLDSSSAEKNEANQLLVQAFDFSAVIEEKEEIEKPVKEYAVVEEAIPEQFFPPCIKKILEGLEDGRKRSLFVLVNFLSNVGWSKDQIEKLVREWNERNQEPLRESRIVGHLRYHMTKKKKALPPNCPPHNMFLKDLQVCNPDPTCAKIKNPVNYSIRKTKYLNRRKTRKNS
ncbi:hypothetical protein D6745_02735 [Candidatus Woesearchaeota archaeon]|nr:MAG: hypothetical protein D6745_02735 [Candidatus Woesearchaeota archaeon]